MKLKPLVKLNKKAQGSGNSIMTIVIFFIVLISILMIGFIMAVGSGIINFVFDDAIPELTNFGVIGDTNLTEATEITLLPLNQMIQQFTWFTGVIYFLMLIGSFAIIFVNKSSPSKWLMVFYFACVLLLIVVSIFISNMYEEFYDDDGELAIRLKEHVILSHMILYSPQIFVILSFITGIVLFSGLGQDDFG